MAARSDAVWQEVVHLVAAFEALHAAVSQSSVAELRAYAAPLAEGLREGQAAVAAGRDGAWPPGLLTGLRQGARELPMFVAMLPESERPAAAQAIEQAGGTWVVALIRGTKRRATAILKRGRIRDEDEYYCVREYVDQLEQRASDEATLRPFYSLLDAYPGTPTTLDAHAG